MYITLTVSVSAHSPPQCVAGHDKLQCQLAELMGAAGASSAADDVVHALGNTPSSSLLAWALAPCLCRAVLPACEASSPQVAYSLHTAYR